MPRERKEKADYPKCHGGNSFGCMREEHKLAADVFCYRCDERMGCTRCVQIARERLCLRCHDWATRTALRIHGPIVRDLAVGKEGLRIVKMICDGRIGAEDGQKLINDLMAKHNQPQRLIEKPVGR